MATPCGRLLADQALTRAAHRKRTSKQRQWPLPTKSGGGGLNCPRCAFVQGSSRHPGKVCPHNMATEYPFVACLLHPGASQPGYAVCNHVADTGTRPFFVIRADSEKLGQILCFECHNNPNLKADQAKLFCADCCKDNGWLF